MTGADTKTCVAEVRWNCSRFSVCFQNQIDEIENEITSHCTGRFFTVLYFTPSLKILSTLLKPNDSQVGQAVEEPATQYLMYKGVTTILEQLFSLSC